MKCPFCGHDKPKVQSKTSIGERVYYCTACQEYFTENLDPNFDISQLQEKPQGTERHAGRNLKQLYNYTQTAGKNLQNRLFAAANQLNSKFQASVVRVKDKLQALTRRSQLFVTDISPTSKQRMSHQFQSLQRYCLAFGQNSWRWGREGADRFIAGIIRLGQQLRLHREWFKPILLGLAIAVVQVLLACVIARSDSFYEAYMKLWQFDSLYYGDIVDRGYQSTIPPDMFIDKGIPTSNIISLPGYPVVSWLVKQATGLPTALSLLLASHIFCWFFWTYVLLFCKRWGLSGKWTFWTVAGIMAHPAAYYLIVAYSESVFLASTLGFIYWVGAESTFGLFIAALHGFLMSATRLVGLPATIYPVVYAFISPPIFNSVSLLQWLRQNIRYFLIAAIASLGAILFFVFCAVKFGKWDLYMDASKALGQSTDYLAIFNLKHYQITWPMGVRGFNRLSVPITMAMLIGVSAIEVAISRAVHKVGQASGWQQRLGFYLCGWLMFYIAASAQGTQNMINMHRYTFPTHIMLVLAVVHLLHAVPSLMRAIRGWAILLLPFLAAVSFQIQGVFLFLFTQTEGVD